MVITDSVGNDNVLTQDVYVVEELSESRLSIDRC